DLQKSLSNFWGSCHRGRGRGPTTASLSVARAMMALGGAGVSEANGVPPVAGLLDGFDRPFDSAQGPGMVLRLTKN
ncbi:MAG: hypothetical protein J5907_10225, partial [Bacteroidales bacterium]|nr:hypothetical protein [Bacteroidales bacterium]